MNTEERLTIEDISRRFADCATYDQMVRSLVQSTFDFFLADCSVPGCTDKACIALESNKCFAHTPGYAWWKRARVKARFFQYVWHNRITGAWRVLRGRATAVED